MGNQWVLYVHIGWQNMNSIDEISTYEHLSSKLELNPTNCSMPSTFKYHRNPMWSQQSICIGSLLGLFQILSFAILSLDLAYRQASTLLALKGIYILWSDSYRRTVPRLYLTEMSSGLKLVTLWVKNLSINMVYFNLVLIHPSKE